MKLLPPGLELRLFYFSRRCSFFVVGSLFISGSSLLGRKKGRKEIRMLISGAGNQNGNGSGFGVSHVITVLAPKYPNRGLARWSSRPGGKRALNGIGSMFCCRAFCHCLGVKVKVP